jgi:hypothetical protein
MSNFWNYMVDHLSGDLDHLQDDDEQLATDKASVYVEQLLLPQDIAITYNLKKQ